jgi:hypothetical protein
MKNLADLDRTDQEKARHIGESHSFVRKEVIILPLGLTTDNSDVFREQSGT